MNTDQPSNTVVDPSASASALIGPTGIWSPELAKTEHRFDPGLARALVRMFSAADFTVVDYGCGPGRYLDAFFRDGLTQHLFGFDGTPYGQSEGGIPILQADLSSSTFIPPLSDVSLCLEVAEHIPAEHQAHFLDNITLGTRKYLVLSWSSPGQGGKGHINERPFQEVLDELEHLRDFWHIDELSDRLRASSTLAWFRTNVAVFRRRSPI